MPPNLEDLEDCQFSMTKLAHFFDDCTDEEYTDMVQWLHKESKAHGYKEIFDGDPSIDAVIYTNRDTAAATFEDYPMVS